VKADEEWEEAKSSLPFGARVRGLIEQHYSFGMLIRLPDFPEVRAVVDAASYTPTGEIRDSTHWPEVGMPIEAVVVDHAEHNRQIKLRVDR
jgi:ribosomal protein S1